MRIFKFIILLIVFPAVASFAQIVTAQDYLNKISSYYGSITDYEANVTITRDSEVMTGVMYYKNPNLLRINFSRPAEQVLVVDKEKLTIYIPKYRVTMSQKLKKRGVSLATKDGLQLLKRNYTVAYLKTPDFVPLDEGSSEMVKKLKFVWRSSDEGFRQIEMSIGENNLIRRMVGITSGYQEIKFDFKNIKLNQNIPDTRFDYDAPATANIFENFLFDAE
ncbi:MAG: outer-membrane lipoprotein carrier protein LolA [Spirochaetia bacterium]|nr:outer-membrane lipoprotein carrier protein LolA [Spirochaetia bacterium]